MQRKNTFTAIMILGLGLMLTIFAFGCGPGFDDETQAKVMKPEILSVTLDPPEASAGEIVTARYLYADERGAIEAAENFWLPVDPTDSDFAGSDSESGGITDTPMGGAEDLLEMAEMLGLMNESVTLPVPEEEGFTFNELGLAAQSISLMIHSGEEAADWPMLIENMMSEVGKGNIKLAIRTLVVSQNEEKNENPVIHGIYFGKDENGELVDFFLHTDDDKATKRKQAAAAALEVNAEKEINFFAEVTDDKTMDDVRFQWISTSGDFQSKRLQSQPFKTPKYITASEFTEEDSDESGKSAEDIDPRKDPNLHPIWLIVRDNGGENQFGQAWAEFYIRVKPE